MATISKILNLLLFIAVVCVSVEVLGLSTGEYTFSSTFRTKKKCKKTFLNNACSASDALSATPTPLTLQVNKKKKVAIKGSCGKYLVGTCGGTPAFKSTNAAYVWEANKVEGKNNPYRIQLANAKCEESFLKAASSSSKSACGPASLSLAVLGETGLIYEVNFKCPSTKYSKNGKCTNCTTSCAAGQYLKSACTATADAVCAACTSKTKDLPECSKPMVLKFDTTKGWEGNEIAVPLLGNVNVVIDWGDGSAPEEVTAAGLKSHTYKKSGTYTVKINGSLSGFGAASDTFASERSYLRKKLIEVVSFGEIGTTTFSYAFYEAENLTKVPNVLPPGVTNLEGMFEMTNNFKADISGWDVSSVTNMSRMFSSCIGFNSDISDWNVSKVTNMSSMFSGATAFNKPLTWGAKTSKVTNMNSMFNFATAFNQDIKGWSQAALTTCTSFKEMCSGLQCSNVPSANPLKDCACPSPPPPAGSSQCLTF